MSILRTKLDNWIEKVVIIGVLHGTYKGKEKIIVNYIDSKKESRDVYYNVNEFTFRMFDRLLKSVGVNENAIENLYNNNENVITLCNDFNVMLRDHTFNVENKIVFNKETKKELISKKFIPNN